MMAKKPGDLVQKLRKEINGTVRKQQLTHGQKHFPFKIYLLLSGSLSGIIGAAGTKLDALLTIERRLLNSMTTI